MYAQLRTVVEEARIWEGSREKSHAFLLSPSVFNISAQKVEELQKLSMALYDCLLGLSHLAVVALDPTVRHGGAWQVFRRVFAAGVPKTYHPMQAMNIRHIPRLLKVDFMVNQRGAFQIAEIDGHNKHGVGYSTLSKRFRDALYPEAKTLPGVVRLLAEELKKREHTTLKLLYADQEHFYLPEFLIAQQEFAKHGITCVVMSEERATTEFLTEGMFLDLPFMYHRSTLYHTIVSAYKEGKVEFIIPPKPFLGSKAVLALLRNDSQDEHLEALLCSFIRAQSLALVRAYIPETILVGKEGESLKAVQERVSGKRYVLKEAISSGMKGTVFSDDPSFNSLLTAAYKSYANWIIQEEVENQPQTFSWYQNGEGEPQLRTAPGWFMRVTAQYVGRQLGDLIITARQDKAVHGAKDCLQIGTVIV